MKLLRRSAATSKPARMLEDALARPDADAGRSAIVLGMIYLRERPESARGVRPHRCLRPEWITSTKLLQDRAETAAASALYLAEGPCSPRSPRPLRDAHSRQARADPGLEALPRDRRRRPRERLVGYRRRQERARGMWAGTGGAAERSRWREQAAQGRAQVVDAKIPAARCPTTRSRAPECRCERGAISSRSIPRPAHRTRHSPWRAPPTWEWLPTSRGSSRQEGRRKSINLYDLALLTT